MSVNFEHAWGDGVAVLRFFNELYMDTTEKPRVRPDTPPAKIDVVDRVKKLGNNLNLLTRFISDNTFTMKISLFLNTPLLM